MTYPAFNRGAATKAVRQMRLGNRIPLLHPIEDSIAVLTNSTGLRAQRQRLRFIASRLRNEY